MCCLNTLSQCWRRADRDVHCLGQAPAARSGSRVRGHPRAGVRDALLPDVYGTDRGRAVTHVHLKTCLCLKNFVFNLMFQNDGLKFLFPSVSPSFELCLLKGFKVGRE